MLKNILVKKMQSKLLKLIYNQVLYHHRIKKLAAGLLKSPLLIKNPLYNYFYNQLLAEKMDKFKKVPFRVMIENTNICQANCVFCPHQAMKRRIGTMEMTLFKKIIDQCQKSAINYVTIYGFGEPLLDKHFFEKVVYAKSAAIPRVTTNTNGMYLTKEKIKKIFNSGIDEIYISFDALTNKTYKKIRPGLDFKTVESNILNLIYERKKRKLDKPEIILSYVETPDNQKETLKYIQKWQNKVNHISISFMHNWTGQIKNQGMLKNGKRDPCRLLWTDMTISWNGDVPLCCNDYENKIILGNINNQSIKQIWGGEKLKKIREYHQKRNFAKVSLCKNCQYNYHHKSPWWVEK